ncbi:MAG: ParA family protein [Simkaniaceae bacterium]|nr:ParA family protein [Simkaniaceae bacterium]
MRKICISLSKGGVGKSTGAVCIAHALAMAGRRVLLVDTDDQGQDGCLLGVETARGLPEVIAPTEKTPSNLLETLQEDNNREMRGNSTAPAKQQVTETPAWQDVETVVGKHGIMDGGKAVDRAKVTFSLGQDTLHDLDNFRPAERRRRGVRLGKGRLIEELLRTAMASDR